MGFSKAATSAIGTAVPEQNVKTAHPEKYVSHVGVNSEDKKVRGQVRMHGIITGYKVAAQLAPTLANTAAGIKDELHKLALEVAAKVESYSFGGE